MYIECPYCKVKKELLEGNYLSGQLYNYRCWNINCRKLFKVFKNKDNKFISVTEKEYKKEWLEH